MQHTCPDHSDRPHDPIERSSAPMGPKCVQACKENPYFEVFITNFHAVAGHVWLAERGPRGGRDFAFEERCWDKASSRACRAMLTPTTTLAGPNGSCLTMYTCKVWSESSSEAFPRLCTTRLTASPPSSVASRVTLRTPYTGDCKVIEAATTTQAVIIGSCLARSLMVPVTCLKSRDSLPRSILLEMCCKSARARNFKISILLNLLQY